MNLVCHNTFASQFLKNFAASASLEHVEKNYISMITLFVICMLLELNLILGLTLNHNFSTFAIAETNNLPDLFDAYHHIYPRKQKNENLPV